MQVFNSTPAVDFDDVNVRSRGAARMIPVLREAFDVAAAWGHVRILRLECAVLRLILGVARERASVAGMIVNLRTASRSTSAQLSSAQE